MGELFAVLAAFVWACAVILFRRSGEEVSPLPLNLFKNAIALPLFLLTLLVLGRPFVPAGLSAGDWGLLLGSGALGIGLGDTLFFTSLNRLGAGRQAIVDCCYSPFMILCAFLYLGEPLHGSLVFAVVLVAGAVVIGTAKARTDDSPGTPVPVGAVCIGMLSMLAMAVGIVIVKPLLAEVDVVWANAVRLAGGIAVLAFPCATRRLRGEVVRVFRPGPLWRVAVPGAVLGTYLGLMFWLLGMKHTLVSRASVLNQTSTIFILVLATILLREPFTKRKLVAIGMGFLGGVLAVV